MECCTMMRDLQYGTKRLKLFAIATSLALVGMWGKPQVANAQQQVNDEISITTSKAIGETITLEISVEGQATAEGIKEKLEDGYGTYTLIANTVKLKGQITSLDCAENNITQLNVSNAKSLKTLICNNNALTSLKIAGLNELTEVTCYENKLEELQVTNCSLLELLSCYGNKLSSLNKITALNCSANTQLEAIDCSSNNIEELTLPNTTSLTTLHCNNNRLKQLNLKPYTNLVAVYLFSNKLSEVPMSNVVTDIVDRNSNSMGDIVVVDTQNKQETNICTKEQVSLLRKKNWHVFDYNGNGDTMKEFDGTTTNAKCIATNNSKGLLYPVPACTVVYLANEQPNEPFTLYNASGIAVYRGFTNNQGNATLNIETLPHGYYLLTCAKNNYPLTK